MAMNFYRADGWVKLVSGQAVPGAQVYILNQPANVTPPITPPRTLPVPFVPNPQAQVYSDAGFTPVSQPIITDGFGHYDFYALPGLYTVAIFSQGKLQQFYIDQTVGNVGSLGNNTVLLSTNGSPNFNQGILNLVQGSNVVLTPDNFGNVTVASTAQGINIEIVGSAFSSQTVLNFVNAGNVTFTDNGSGQLSASVIIPPVGLPLPDTARFVLWQAQVGGFSIETVCSNGISISDGGANNVAFSSGDATHGPNFEIQVPGGFRQYASEFFLNPARKIMMEGIFQYRWDVIAADANMYHGMGNVPTGDIITGDCISLLVRKQAGLDPPHFKLVTSVAGVVTNSIDSGVAVVQNTRYKWKIIVNNGVATLFINGTSIAVASSGLTTAIMGPVWLLGGFTNSGSTFMRFEYMYGECTSS
jgi:hypothetical protein